jgi:hypothetical protein
MICHHDSAGVLVDVGVRDPPNARFTTSSGFMSSPSVFHFTMLELPVKTMLSRFGGLARSASSNLRIVGSQSCTLAGAGAGVAPWAAASMALCAIAGEAVCALTIDV